MIRELLKPPFEDIGFGFIADGNGWRIRVYSENTDMNKNVAVIDWITAALNNQWQRDIGGKDERT